MLQLANGLELAGEESKALKWYNDLIAAAPKDSPIALKGRGAKTRLESVGKTIRLQGKSATGKGMVDLANYKGKVVLIHYWSSAYGACTVDIPLLQSLIAKYGKNFAVLGVSFDDDPQTLLAFLKQNHLPWEQIYEKGGLDSRLANEMGILTMPTMILVDKQGKVINRGTHAAELDSELRNLNLGKGADREAAGRDAPRR
jgi:peroxiredoxin